MLRLSVIFSIIFAITVIGAMIGPRPDMDTTIKFIPNSLPTDLDEYLDQKELSVKNLREGSAKEIIWNNDQVNTQTELAVLYIHGFSASKVEISPIPENVAEELGANLFFTRLKGHGRDGMALAEAKLSDWLNDMVEASAIGGRLGKKIILLTTSTGSTLATWLASKAEYNKNIAGIVMVSPNFALKGASTGLINMPWAETILPMIFGDTISYEAKNEAHGKGWTTSYPSTAIFPMAALLRLIADVDYQQIQIPALVFYAKNDTVVSAKETENVMEHWGGDTQIILVEDSQNKNQHLITGDILSPNTTGKITQAIVNWAKAL